MSYLVAITVLTGSLGRNKPRVETSLQSCWLVGGKEVEKDQSGFKMPDY